MNKLRITTLCIALFCMLGIIASANTAGAEDNLDLAKTSQNPVGKLISVPFENNLYLNAGPEEETDYALILKPVVPVSLGGNWTMINRLITPFISQGERGPGQGRIFGLGDSIYQGFFTPAKPGKVILGVGPQLGIPTGMDRATSDQWTLGPTVVVLTMPGNWVMGFLTSNVWNIGSGYNDAPNVNAFSFQYFFNYNLKDGWYLTTTPTITADWNAEGDNVWTVPFGGGVGRVFKWGKQSMSITGKGFYNVERPDNAPDWNLQLRIALLFPKK